MATSNNSNPPPWASDPHRHPPQPTLPPFSAINAGNPPSEMQRDSGNWSMSTSQRTSAVSQHSVHHHQQQPPLTLPPVDTLSRNSPGDPNHPAHHHYPSSSQSPISTSFHGASTTSLQGHSPGQQYRLPGSVPPGPDGLPTPSPSVSRRSSFDSRLQNLQLSPPSGTPVGSQISLANTLLNGTGHRDSIPPNPLTTQISRDRGIHSNSPISHSTPFQNGTPVSSANSSSQIQYAATTRSGPIPSRTAPPIAPISRGYAATSTIPVKGQAWAFPDPDLDDSRSVTEARNSTTSLPGSTASSLYSAHTNHGHPSLPTVVEMAHHHHHHPSQRGPLPGIDTHHHPHQGAQRRTSLLSVESTIATPYSRTPELRVSHKLAERKRRKEMKELFDELRDALPAERGGKSSKWEVLTKAIEHCKNLAKELADKDAAIVKLQSEVEMYRQAYGVLPNQGYQPQSQQNGLGGQQQMGYGQQGGGQQGQGQGGGGQQQQHQGERMQGLQAC